MNLGTDFLTLKLKNPIIAGASPLSSTLDGIKRLEDAGAAAVIAHSLFEEQINHEQRQIDHFIHITAESHAEAISYFQAENRFDNFSAERYLREIEEAKAALSIPLIGSLNGVSAGGWVQYAKAIEAAGADALELNITYIPTSMHLSGAEVEQMYVQTVASVREYLNIPLNIKMNAYFSSPAHMARRFVELGIAGVTIFDNPTRVDIDLELLTALRMPNITTSQSLSETLRWCAILYRQLPCTICAGTGVHTHEDLLKALMSGANTAALASVLLRHGAEHIGVILQGLEAWMEAHEYESVRQMIGSISLAHTDNPAAFERNSYMYALQHYRS
ncbi:MAG: dihydroorotate dehydrogenase-like protein [Campylobacterales bacterium]|nr:dihydroorotate dehydrogenase-like protein [Campylobacterales bacterium]